MLNHVKLLEVEDADPSSLDYMVLNVFVCLKKFEKNCRLDFILIEGSDFDSVCVNNP
jgi:hypothetical protein